MVLNPAITAQIKGVLKSNPQGLSITDIVNFIKINRNTAGRYLENLLVSGQVEMRHFGMAKMYTLSHRVPVSAVLSISSEHIMQLDSSLRIVFANEPFLILLNTTSKDLFGKNIAYSSMVTVFDDLFDTILTKLKTGLSGVEWHGDLELHQNGINFSCHIVPMVSNEGTKGVTLILEDITDKKKNEDRVKISEMRLSNLLGNIPGMAYRCHNDQNWTMEYVSKGCFNLTGYEAGSLVGNTAISYADLVHPDDQDMVWKQVQDGVKHQTHFRITYRIRTAEGREKWVWEQGHEVETVPGQPEILEGLIVDITERKNMEEALRQSEDRFRKIFEEGPLGMTVVGADFRFRQVNRKMCELLGYTREEFLEKTVPDVTHPDCRENDDREIHALFRGDISEYQTEKKYIKKDGQIIWGSITVTPLLDRQNTAISVLALIEDITARKKADSALKNSEERYRRILERSFDAIAIHRDGIVVLANDKAAELLGAATPEDLIGVPSINVIRPNSRDSVASHIKTMGESGENTAVDLIEEKLVRLDGKEIDIEAVVSMYVDEGHPTIQVVFRDISERKKLAEALRQSEEQYRTLTEHSQNGVFILQDGIIQYVNRGFARILDTSRKALINLPIEKLIYPDDREWVMDQAYRRQRGESVPENYECRFVKSDGTSPITISMDVGVITYQGRPANMGTIRDITQSKITEETLKKSEERFRRVFEDGPLGMSVTDARFRFTAVNAKFCELFGYSNEEILKKTFLDLTHPEHQSRDLEGVKKLISGEIPVYRAEKKYVRKNGSAFWALLTATPVHDDEGKVHSVIALIEDINERKIAEKYGRE